MTKKLKIVIASLLLPGFLIANNASAATSSATEQVTSTLAASCVISAPDVSFGTYNSSNSSPTLASQNITVHCTKGSAFTMWTGIDFAYWTTYQGSLVAIMKNSAGDPLYFQVYISSANIWANDTNYQTSYHISSTGTGDVQNFNFNYRILANQFTTPGSYSAPETAIVSF